MPPVVFSIIYDYNRYSRGIMKFLGIVKQGESLPEKGDIRIAGSLLIDSSRDNIVDALLPPANMTHLQMKAWNFAIETAIALMTGKGITRDSQNRFKEYLITPFPKEAQK